MTAQAIPDGPGYGIGVRYWGAGDPGAVGARELWFDGTYLSIRNAANTAWVQLGGAGSVPDLATVLMQGADAGGVTITNLGAGVDPTDAAQLDQAGSGGGTPAILLDYALSSDLTNVALTGGSPTDIIANQNFTKVAAGSLIEVIVRGCAFCEDATYNEYCIQIVIDSAGTPITKIMGAAESNSDTFVARNNPFGGGSSVYISGLSAATHTVKVQILPQEDDHLYCRASGEAPQEFANVQVIEHL